MRQFSATQSTKSNVFNVYLGLNYDVSVIVKQILNLIFETENNELIKQVDAILAFYMKKYT